MQDARVTSRSSKSKGCKHIKINNWHGHTLYTGWTVHSGGRVLFHFRYALPTPESSIPMAVVVPTAPVCWTWEAQWRTLQQNAQQPVASTDTDEMALIFFQKPVRHNVLNDDQGDLSSNAHLAMKFIGRPEPVHCTYQGCCKDKMG